MERGQASRTSSGERPLATASVRELFAELVKETRELAKAEIDLARAELQADLNREIKMAKGLVAAAVCLMAGIDMLLVALVFALAGTLPGWAAALVLAAVFFSIAAIVGLMAWGSRVRRPLERTLRTLKEDVRWARERMA
jgi:uncharacterized membrane protein YqjE